jgi:hypothetical protein
MRVVLCTMYDGRFKASLRLLELMKTEDGENKMHMKIGLF